MKKVFYFNEQIITYNEELLDNNASIITLEDVLEMNGWKVDKTIARKGYSSSYKYNMQNNWKIGLVDCKGERRLISMHQEIYVDDQMSELCKRQEFQSTDWFDFDKNELIENIKTELDELKQEPYRIETIIELANEFKKKLETRQ